MDACHRSRHAEPVTSSEKYDETDAERYDADNANVSTLEALDPMLEVLVALAGSGKVLEP